MQLQVGRYTLGERLGDGAFGVVFRAAATETQRPVAVKHLQRTDPAALYRFKSEFRAIAGLVPSAGSPTIPRCAWRPRPRWSSSGVVDPLDAIRWRMPGFGIPADPALDAAERSDRGAAPSRPARLGA